MRSASHSDRLAVASLCALLAIAGLAGCTTTQEKAAKHQAESERILEARAERQKRKHDKSAKTDQDGSEKR